MTKNIELGVRLTADGKGFVGAVTVSDKALRRFTAGGRQAARSARDTARATRGLERQMRGLGQSASAAHGKIAGYAAGILSINRLAASMRAVLDATVRQEQALAQVEARMRSTGGAAGLTTRQVADMGLSPRVRGNRKAVASTTCTCGSIPACAGEPRPGCGPGSGTWVYPRVCGGTRSAATPRGWPSGLSPRVRGNPSLRHA